jgi:hypothetical protein
MFALLATNAEELWFAVAAIALLGMVTFGLDAGLFRHKRASRRDGPEQAAHKSRIRYVIVDHDSDEPEAETSNRSNP